MHPSDLDLLARIGSGLGMSYVLGFEREVRGSVAGDRTFALVGTSAAAITAVTYSSSPQAIAGIVTGIGFIGGAVVFRGRTGSPHGVTTAATILASAALGIVVGYGRLLLGLVVTAAVLVLLEAPHIPGLRAIDSRTLASRFRDDPGGPDPVPPGRAGDAGAAPGG